MANDVNEMKRPLFLTISHRYLKLLTSSGRFPVAEKYSKLALPSRSMEKFQHCARITAQRDRVMVCQQQYILRMESFRTKFPPMDLWETSVATQRLHFPRH